MNRTGLLEWQGPAAEQLLVALKKHGAALDGSDMGTGKSAHALAVIRELDVPALVVCPSVTISSWRRLGKLLNVEFSCLNYEAIRAGNTPFGEWEHPRPKVSEKVYRCETCQQKFKSPAEAATRRCPHQRIGIHCLSVKSKPHRYGKFRWSPAIKLLVFDEVHRCAALDSLNADMLIAAKRQGIPTLALSATTASDPLDLRALGYILGLHSLSDYFKWAFARGVRRFPLGGFHWPVSDARKREIMAGVHSEIFPERGARVRIDELGTAFPEVQITAELYDLAEAGRIDRLYAAMDDAMLALHAERSLDRSPEHPLTVLLRASQEIELLTVPVYESLVADALAQGFHVAIFVNYRRTVDELCRRLKTNCRIDGGQTGEYGKLQREICVEDFVRDAEPVIVSTISAGGVGLSLPDLHGDFPRLGLVAPNNDARAMRQVFGRLPRATSKSKSFYRVVLIAGTVQERIHKNFSGKLNCIDALNDSDLQACNLPLTPGVFPEAE